MKPSYAQLKLAVAAGLMVAAVPSAFAATAANTTVTNTVLVDYKVGTVSQTQISASANFKVDRKIDVTVAEDSGAAVSVVPNSTANMITYTVTNNTNDTQDFRITATQQSGGALVYGGTDNFNVSNLTFFVESGTTVGFQALEDTATFIDELGSGSSKKVYVFGDILASQANGDKAGIRVTAIAAQSTTGTGAYSATVGTLASDSAETNVSALNEVDASFVDTVFADTTATGGNTAQDGQALADGQYNVVTATIAVTKTSVVVSDPINGGTNPKAIPGATIEYCIDVNNTGAAAASSVSIADLIPTNTTFVSGSITSAAVYTGGGSATLCDVGSGTSEDDNATGLDDTTGDAGNYDSGTTTVTVTTPSIAASSRFKATFRVTVD